MKYPFAYTWLVIAGLFLLQIVLSNGISFLVDEETEPVLFYSLSGFVAFGFGIVVSMAAYNAKSLLTVYVIQQAN